MFIQGWYKFAQLKFVCGEIKMAEIALSAALTAIGNAALNIMGNAVQNIIGNFAEEERNRLYGLSGDIGWIQGKMRQIQAYLKDADSKPVRTQEMTALIENIRDLCYDMEDVLETFLPQMESYNSPATAAEIFFRRSIWKFSYWSTAHNFAMEIAKIRTRIEDIDRPITSYDITAGGAERSIWDPRRPRLYADEPDIVGFNRDIQVLKARLVDESEIKLNFISIVGMPGLGKTSLAKNLFRSTRDQFQCSALVYVSQQPNVTEITKDIARQVGLEVEKWEDNLEAKLANLTEHLREKRYVIMFDDIWDNQTWDALKTSIPINSKNGSRIILTSRISGVGRYIGGESSLHELQPLDPGSSWQLFYKMVMGHVENATDTPCLPSELEDIGRKIVKRCGGVPLAIVVTAGSLREKERREHSWSEVLNRMGSYDVETKSILGLSYKDLPIELRPCFLYLGLFPEDYEVLAFQLINIWVAEKFIKVERSGQTLEEVGEAYLNNLVARNLIQVASRERDGRIRSCRIHDLLRELCIDMAEESNFFATIKLISTSPTRVRRVSNACPEVISGVIERAHQTPKLRSFLCFDRYDFLSMKQLKNLCRSCRFIRVLSVTIGAGKCSSASLPNEIGNLIHLSYLEIWTRYYVSLRFPNTISNLKSLLTLNLQRCYAIVSLPACFWKLKQLRHILLPQVGPHDVSLSERIWKQLHRSLALKNFDEISLPNLQTLTACSDGVLKAKGFSKVTSLQKLGIDYCNEFDLSLCQNLSKMQLRYQSGYLPNTNKFPPNLTELTLIWTKLSEDSMETLGKLSNLKILILGMNFYAGDRIVCSRADFPQLQVLQFSYLSDLEELIVEEGGMPCLLELIINHCKKLKVLPDRFQNMIVYCHPSTYEEYMKLYPQFSDDEYLSSWMNLVIGPSSSCEIDE